MLPGQEQWPIPPRGGRRRGDDAPDRGRRGPSRSTRLSTPDAAATSEAGADPRFTAETTGMPPPPPALSLSTAPPSRSALWKATASAHRPRAASTAFSSPAGMSRRETRAPRAPSAVSTARRDSMSTFPDSAASSASTLAPAAATARRASVIASSQRTRPPDRTRAYGWPSDNRPGTRIPPRPGPESPR